MTTQLDAKTIAQIEDHKRVRDGKRQLIIQMLREMGLDVEDWEEARWCLRMLLGR